VAFGDPAGQRLNQEIFKGQLKCKLDNQPVPRGEDPVGLDYAMLVREPENRCFDRFPAKKLLPYLKSGVKVGQRVRCIAAGDVHLCRCSPFPDDPDLQFNDAVTPPALSSKGGLFTTARSLWNTAYAKTLGLSPGKFN
jgi:hypothetical protein